MSESKLVKLNQVVLKKLINALYKTLLEEGEENPKIFNLSDDAVFRSIEYVLNLIGFGDGEYADIDFIFALYSKNYHLIKDGKIEGDLSIPSIGLYTFSIDVTERVVQTITYKHIVESYSKNNAVPMAQREEDSGDFSVWEGDNINTEYHDSETDNIEWNNDVKEYRKK